jgi:hypothetical protein
MLSILDLLLVLHNFILNVRLLLRILVFLTDAGLIRSISRHAIGLSCLPASSFLEFSIQLGQSRHNRNTRTIKLNTAQIVIIICGMWNLSIMIAGEERKYATLTNNMQGEW